MSSLLDNLLPELLRLKRLQKPERRSPTYAEMPYIAKCDFFTASEQSFYEILNAKLDAFHHTVFPKVRLGDFIKVENLNSNYGSWVKIRSRHVDFLVWDLKGQKIVLAIELDGNSHNSYKAQKTDAFKNEVFKSIGLPLHRVRVGTNFYEEIDRVLAESLRIENNP